MDKRVSFDRKLKPRHVSLIAIGGIVGSSFFLGTGYVYNQVGPFTFLAFILGAFITFLTMQCQAELASSEEPDHLSFVGYAAKWISPSWACGVGWSYWANWIVYIPAECIAAGILTHSFLPSVPIYAWAMFFGLLITYFNVKKIKFFGEVSFWMTLLQLLLLVLFCLFAIFIFFTKETEPVLKEQAFPHGIGVLFMNMVILLVNFQGAEIIGLSASETQNAKTEIPRSLKSISFQIAAIYLIPLLFLTLIFPWQKAGLSGSVFASAIDNYGFPSWAKAFTILIVLGALSCASSGLYATVRSLHALTVMKMGPKAFQDLNKYGTPVKATLATFGAIWIVLSISWFFPPEKLYANLLALSGFTGSICWISLCISQLRFRKSLKLSDQKKLPFRIPLFPYLTYFAIGIQILCLIVVAWSPELRSSLYFGVPALLLPILFYKLREVHLRSR